MKRMLSALIVVFIACIASQAFALSDRDYGAMMRDTNFAEADSNLNSAWSEAKSAMSPGDFASLKKSQSQWIKTGRDNDARKLIKSQGLSKVEAYAQATNDRAEYIRSMIHGDPDSDPYGEFASSLEKIAERITKEKPAFVDGDSRIWAGEDYVLAKSGKYLSEFFIAGSGMTFAGGLKIGSSDSDVRKFFGDSLQKNDDGTYYSGGIHQWTEFDARGGRLKSIHFTQADAPVGYKAGEKFSEYVSSLQK